MLCFWLLWNLECPVLICVTMLSTLAWYQFFWSSTPVIGEYGGFVPLFVMSRISCVAALFVLSFYWFRFELLHLYYSVISTAQILIFCVYWLCNLWLWWPRSAPCDVSIIMFHALLVVTLYWFWLLYCWVYLDLFLWNRSNSNSLFCIFDAVVLLRYELGYCLCNMDFLQWVLLYDLFCWFVLLAYQ